MNTTQTGYTESDAKVQARAERRAWLNEIALADFWANEVLRVRRSSDTDLLIGAMHMCMTDPAHKRLAAHQDTTPQDVRTVAERNLDQWQEEVIQTRETDRPL